MTQGRAVRERTPARVWAGNDADPRPFFVARGPCHPANPFPSCRRGGPACRAAPRPLPAREVIMSSHPPPLILYVDDDAFNRRLFTQYLREAGFRTPEAATGNHALRLAPESPDPPGLLIVHLHLP